MAIDYKVSVSINDIILTKYWDNGLREELDRISYDGASAETYGDSLVVEFEDYERAIKAERELFNLVDRYEELDRRSTTTQEMTIAEIEEKLGHPIKVIK